MLRKGTFHRKTPTPNLSNPVTTMVGMKYRATGKCEDSPLEARGLESLTEERMANQINDLTAFIEAVKNEIRRDYLLEPSIDGMDFFLARFIDRLRKVLRDELSESEYVWQFSNMPNAATQKAIAELESGIAERFKTIDALLADLNKD